LIYTECVNFALSFVAARVPDPFPIGVSATSAFTFRAASLPHGDHTSKATSSCLVYLPLKGPGISSAVET
jgi:hypothetical protein